MNMPVAGNREPARGRVEPETFSRDGLQGHRVVRNNERLFSQGVAVSLKTISYRGRNLNPFEFGD